MQEGAHVHARLFMSSTECDMSQHQMMYPVSVSVADVYVTTVHWEDLVALRAVESPQHQSRKSLLSQPNSRTSCRDRELRTGKTSSPCALSHASAIWPDVAPCLAATSSTFFTSSRFCAESHMGNSRARSQAGYMLQGKVRPSPPPPPLPSSTAPGPAAENSRKLETTTHDTYSKGKSGLPRRHLFSLLHQLQVPRQGDTKGLTKQCIQTRLLPTRFLRH